MEAGLALESCVDRDGGGAQDPEMLIQGRSHPGGQAPLLGTEDNSVPMCWVMFRVGLPEICVNSRSKMPFGCVHVCACVCTCMRVCVLSWELRDRGISPARGVRLSSFIGARPLSL